MLLAALSAFVSLLIGSAVCCVLVHSSVDEEFKGDWGSPDLSDPNASRVAPKLPLTGYLNLALLILWGRL